MPPPYLSNKRQMEMITTIDFLMQSLLFYDDIAKVPLLSIEKATQFLCSFLLFFTRLTTGSIQAISQARNYHD